MPKNLVIVESPAKAKTIEKILGSDFQVKSCFGHIRDLAKGDDAINKELGYLPKYEVSPDKKQLVAELKKLSKSAELVWLASDEDREGEAISWHLAEVLDLPQEKTRRIVFNEITKSAILKAIEKPRSIDKDLVDAQQARRVLDRLVGFELSPVLWRKVKPSLSAGRVQSVAVRLIVEREREINEFNAEKSFRITALFETAGKSFKAELPQRFATATEAEAYLKSCIGADYVVNGVEVKPSFRKPAAPFTTSTLQQEASRKLGYGVTRTMQLAQRLYEAGHITYMRTDSTNLSQFALAAAKETITSQYGDSYVQTRQYATKNASAQEAHEAIRPTDFSVRSAGDDDAQRRLYEMIWKRTLASQMSDARFEKTEVQIGVSTNKTQFVANGEVLLFDGFLKVYLEGKDDDDEDEAGEGLLPVMRQGDRLKNLEITATERFSRPPARYTEASLVKKLEELGIGRPSTYAPTISTIQKREYVVKESREGEERKFEVMTLKGADLSKKVQSEITGAEKNKLFPSDIGKVVTDFLVEHFSQIMDYGFTAAVEKEFDDIAQGQKKWNDMIDAFYHPFHKEVDKSLDIKGKVTGERLLGLHPETGKKVVAKIGRYGAMIQIGEAEGDDKPQFASLQKHQSLDTITMDEALELFKLPRKIGEFEGKQMEANVGRFGPYVKHDGKFYSLAKTDDPMSVDAARAIEIIEAKRESDANRVIKTFADEPGLEILNGRWGPYIAYKGKNFKIPKNTDPSVLDVSACMALIEEQKSAPKKGGKAPRRSK